MGGGRKMSEGSHRCVRTFEPGLQPSLGKSHSCFMHVIFEEMSFSYYLRILQEPVKSIQ